MSHWKLTSAAALLVATTAPGAAAQCVTGTCEEGSTQFVSDPIVDELSGPAPFGSTTLTLPQFDATVYAGMHGTTPGNISLIGVSIDFLASVDPLIQLDSGTGSACMSSWVYDTGVVIVSNPSLGIPGSLATSSDSGVANLPAGNGTPPPWDVTVNPTASMDAFCFAEADDLDPWIGTGQIDLATDSYAVFSTSGCATIVTGFMNTAVLRATLRWLYCVAEGGGPGGPGTPFCFGDGTGTPCPCGNAGLAGQGCANSLGMGAMLSATGTDSVSADDIAFEAVNLRPNQPALLFVGLNAINGGDGVVFGDGLRCAGGTVERLGIETPDPQGVANWGPGLAPLGEWMPGDTRRFQTWYRDPGGSPCGNNFNLSNGYEVNFMP